MAQIQSITTMKKVSILTYTTLLCIALLAACKTKQATTSQFAPWLQEKITAISDRNSSVTLYEMNGETYYAVFCEGPERSYDMNRNTIYDAEGNVYLRLGGLKKRTEKELRFFDRAINKGVIWQSEISKERHAEE